MEYVPVEFEAVRPDEEVRVRLSNDGAVMAARQIGRIETELVGTVAPRGSDSLAVSVPIGRDYPGTPFETVTERVVVPRTEVNEIRRGRFSFWRTGVVVAAIGVVTWALIDSVVLQENPNPPDENGPDPPPPAIIPGFGTLTKWLGGAR